MKTVYDMHYRDAHYFGDPYPGLVEFFRAHEPKGKVLDLGCGQGRDALFLTQLGYQVHGVDHSVVGLDQLQFEAGHLGVQVTTELADAYTYPIPEEVDMVLLDSMLHFYKNDLEVETAFVNHVLDGLRPGGFFVNCIVAGKKREKTLKKILGDHTYDWQVVHEAYVDYQGPEDFQATYHLYVVSKGKRDE